MATILAEPTTPGRPAPAATSGGRPRTYRPDIEGLRAVAVLLVVLYHGGISWLPGGYVGVDVFFVISGFLITSLLLREHDTTGRFSFTDFYARRARRILPIASLVLIATVGAAAVLLTSTRLDPIAHDGAWTAVFGANFHFASSGADYLNSTAPPSPLQHFWSLAVEEQFYVVWPLLLWAALRLARRSRRSTRAWPGAVLVVAIAASLGWSIIQTGSDATAAYFSPFTRAWELGTGALIAVGVGALARLPRAAGIVLSWTGLGLIGFAAASFDTATAFPGSAAVVPVLGAALVIGGGVTKQRAGAESLLALWPMRRLGAYSYSLYLVHWPILIIAEERHPNLGVSARLALVVVSVALAAVVYHWLENPVRRSPRLVADRRASLAVGVAAILVAAVYSTMFVVGGQATLDEAKARYQYQQQQAGAVSTAKLYTSAQLARAVTAAAAASTVPSDVSPPLTLAARDLSDAYKDGCLVDTGPVTSPSSCVYGDKTATRTVVLLGDSHAAQWLPALDALGDRRQVKIVVLAKHSCPIAAVHTYDGIVKRYYNECVQWRSWALNRIRTLKPIAVVATETTEALVDASGGQTDFSEQVWQSALARSMRQLSADGKVFFLADTPIHRQDTPTCLQQNSTAMASCADPRAVALNDAHQARDRATVEQSGGSYVDTTPWFCTATTCPPVIAGTVTSFDGSHMTATFAGLLSHALGVDLGLESSAATQNVAGEAAVRSAVAEAAAAAYAPTVLTPDPALAGRDISPAYTDGCLVPALQTTSPTTCQFGPRDAAKRVVLFGDSHAAQWMPALVDVADRERFDLIVLTKGNCPAPDMTVFSAELKRPFSECDTWRAWAYNEIAAIKPATVLVSSTFHGVTLPGGTPESTAAEAAWDAGLTRTLTALGGTGARVEMIGDVPSHDQAVPACVTAHPDSLSDCATPADRAILVKHRAIERAVVKRAGAGYVETQGWFCAAGSCPAVIGGMITEFDDSHLTATYAHYLSHVMGLATGLER